MNRDFFWDTLVDAIDDHYHIEREDRVRLINTPQGPTLTEGRIDTFYLSASTLVEPWAYDTVTFYDKLEATFQSIRKKAVVHVTPTEQGGFLVEVAVYKELEDLMQPMNSPAGTATLRHDTSQQHVRQAITAQPEVSGWIPQGRDPALEQRIIHTLLVSLGLEAPVWEQALWLVQGKQPQKEEATRLSSKPLERPGS